MMQISMLEWVAIPGVLECLPFPPPGDLPDPGITPESPAVPAWAGRFFTTELPGLPRWCACVVSVMSNSLQPHGLYVAHQAPLFMGFSWQEYWNGLPFPPSVDLPD